MKVYYTARNVEAYSQKLAANDSYRVNYCLTQDLSILVRTAFWMLRGRGWRCASHKDSPAAQESILGE